MLNVDLYGDYKTAWCPGCGNFGILNAVKKALAASDIRPHEVLFVSGIGQAAKAPHYLNCNLFNGLHGRSLPVATGAKLANPALKVLVESGDGCSYGEGGNHFLAAVRRNIDITVIVHDNMVYGLTKGQASPTSPEGFVTKAQPHGAPSGSLNPLAVALAAGASFVARAFAGEQDHLASVLVEAIRHKGLSLVDVLQPCVSFNKINTFSWFKKRCHILGKGYDASNPELAMKTAREFGEQIPLGVIFRSGRPAFDTHFSVLSRGALWRREVDRIALGGIIERYL